MRGLTTIIYIIRTSLELVSNRLNDYHWTRHSSSGRKVTVKQMEKNWLRIGLMMTCGWQLPNGYMVLDAYKYSMGMSGKGNFSFQKNILFHYCLYSLTYFISRTTTDSHVRGKIGEEAPASFLQNHRRTKDNVFPLKKAQSHWNYFNSVSKWMFGIAYLASGTWVSI